MLNFSNVMKNNKIAVIGDGGWGTTLAILLHNKNYEVVLWSAFSDYASVMAAKRENTKYLPDIKIPEGVKITSGIQDLKGAAYYIVAVPCRFLKDTVSKFKGVIEAPVISVTKGIDTVTLKRPSETIVQELGDVRLAVLSGPTIAYETARGVPTTCVAASPDANLAFDVQQLFCSDTFRIYRSTDVTGVELAGALKNIIAIAAGVADGMGFGANTKAAILTRGLVEIARLGVKMGAREETFNGLSGVGDLATTCMSLHSRNRWFGEQIGKGKKMADVLGTTNMVVEGITTTESAHKLAVKYQVEMPITEEIFKVLYEGKDARKAVRDLMTRLPKSE